MQSQARRGLRRVGAFPGSSSVTTSKKGAVTMAELKGLDDGVNGDISSSEEEPSELFPSTERRQQQKKSASRDENSRPSDEVPASRALYLPKKSQLQDSSEGKDEDFDSDRGISFRTVKSVSRQSRDSLALKSVPKTLQ